MAKYKEKFIVINNKHLDNLPLQVQVDLLQALLKAGEYIPENKYLVCNQDEPYADNVLETILSGEDAKKVADNSNCAKGIYVDNKICTLELQKAIKYVDPDWSAEGGHPGFYYPDGAKMLMELNELKQALFTSRIENKKLREERDELLVTGNKLYDIFDLPMLDVASGIQGIEHAVQTLSKNKKIRRK